MNSFYRSVVRAVPGCHLACTLFECGLLTLYSDFSQAVRCKYSQAMIVARTSKVGSRDFVGLGVSPSCDLVAFSYSKRFFCRLLCVSAPAHRVELALGVRNVEPGRSATLQVTL